MSNQSGTGTAFGAVSIINGTATGHGCSLAIDAMSKAEWLWRGDGLRWESPVDDRLAKTIWPIAKRLTGQKYGARASCETTLPIARGLKTSSAAATSMLRAACDAADHPIVDVSGPAIEAVIEAGVTLTGAFDDQIAVERGGCHLTDNTNRTVIKTIEVPALDVAIWVPHAAVPKRQLRDLDASLIAGRINAAEQMLLDGDLGGAMRLNGQAFHALYRAAGLPVDDKPATIAMHEGALGAGLSGTGPSVGALFEGRVDLPPHPGGEWFWYSVVP